jgi:hypothetical protein
MVKVILGMWYRMFQLLEAARGAQLSIPKHQYVFDGPAKHDVYHRANEHSIVENTSLPNSKLHVLDGV